MAVQRRRALNAALGFAEGKKDQGVFALDVACHALTFFSEYFGIDYVLPKADMGKDT